MKRCTEQNVLWRVKTGLMNTDKTGAFFNGVCDVHFGVKGKAFFANSRCWVS